MKTLFVVTLAVAALATSGTARAADHVATPPRSSGEFTPYRAPTASNIAFNHNVLADFDGDGILDDAVTAGASSNLSIYPGNGDGTFGYPVQFTLGNGGYELVAGDFDGDGRVDIAELSYQSSTGGHLTVLLNAGNRSFVQAPGSPYQLQPNSSSSTLAVGDVNGDGRLDLVVGNYYPDTMITFLGQGNGSFVSTATTSGGSSNVEVVRLADVNDDGRLDLVAGFADGHIASFLGAGNGTFSAPITTSVSSSYVGDLRLADYDRDGNVDVAAATGTGTTYVLSGNGNGTFTSRSALAPVSGASAAISVGFGDFDEDGLLDLVVSYDNYPGLQAQVFRNNGNETFSARPGASFDPRTDFDSAVSVGDVNNDGTPDTVFSVGAGPITLTNDGTGRLGLVSLRNEADAGATGPMPIAVRTADVNGDGRLDIVTVSSSVLTTLLANSGGGYTAVTQALPKPPVALVVGNFGGDSRPDLAYTTANGTVFAYRGNGDGSFTRRYKSAAFGTSRSLVAGDFNGDGRLDLAVAGGGSTLYSVLLNTGGFAFTTTTTAASGAPLLVSVGAGDLNGDGKLDLVFAAGGTANDVMVFDGNGDGTFSSAGSYAVAANPRAVAVADVNRDGRADIVTASGSAKAVTLLLAKSGGGYQSSKSSAPYPLDSLAIGDVNGDGYPDVLAASSTTSTATELLGSAAGLITPLHETFNVAGSPVSIALGDLAGTHILSLAVASAATQQVWVANQH